MASKHSQNDKLDLKRGFPEGLEMFDVMDTCEDFVRYAKGRKEWLEKWIDLPEGIPCANSFLRIFAAIDPAVFGECLLNFVTTLSPDLKGRLVNIDGKTLRGSRKADESTVQIVSAWAQHNGLTLAQQAVDKKSNEITAVPKLLRLLNLKGGIVTLDAMGLSKP